METGQDVFSGNYEEARNRWRLICELQKLEHWEVSLMSYKDPAAIGFTWLGPKDAHKLLIHTSGLHGVEGHLGSAVQLAFLNKKVVLPSGVGVLLVHVINPFGMTYGRRVNANNVDLNRNFIVDWDAVLHNSLYDQMTSFLNPSSVNKAQQFWFPALGQLFKNGFKSIQQAIAQGQYSHPKGVFYGGGIQQEEVAVVLSEIERIGHGRGHIAHLDVHCGLGSYGNEGLYLEGTFDSQWKVDLERAFGCEILHVKEAQKTAYAIKGGFIQRLQKSFDPKTFVALTQEFGVAKPIKIFKALRRENFDFHYQAAKRDQAALARLFCPADPAWRSAVLEKGVNRILATIHYLRAR